MHDSNLVTVSRSDLVKLVEFQKTLSSAFSEMSALYTVIAEKSDGVVKTLADLGDIHARNWEDYCIDDCGAFARLEAALDSQYKGDSK